MTAKTRLPSLRLALGIVTALFCTWSMVPARANSIAKLYVPPLEGISEASVVELQALATKPENLEHLEQIADEIDDRHLATLTWLEILDHPQHPLYEQAINHLFKRYLNYRTEPDMADVVFLKLAPMANTGYFGYRNLCEPARADRQDPPRPAREQWMRQIFLAQQSGELARHLSDPNLQGNLASCLEALGPAARAAMPSLLALHGKPGSATQRAVISIGMRSADEFAQLGFGVNEINGLPGEWAPQMAPLPPAMLPQLSKKLAQVIAEADTHSDWSYGFYPWAYGIYMGRSFHRFGGYDQLVADVQTEDAARLLVKEHLIAQAGRVGTAAIPALRAAVRDATPLDEQIGIAKALANIGTIESIALSKQIITRRMPDMLSDLKRHEDIMSVLTQTTGGYYPSIERFRLLGPLAIGAKPQLLEMLHSNDAEVRAKAARVLGFIKASDTYSAILQTALERVHAVDPCALRESEEGRAFSFALEDLGGANTDLSQMSLQDLQQLASSQVQCNRTVNEYTAIHALGQRGPAAVPALLAAVRTWQARFNASGSSNESHPRDAALGALAAIEPVPRESLPAILALFDEEDRESGYFGYKLHEALQHWGFDRADLRQQLMAYLEHARTTAGRRNAASALNAIGIAPQQDKDMQARADRLCAQAAFHGDDGCLLKGAKAGPDLPERLNAPYRLHSSFYLVDPASRNQEIPALIAALNDGEREAKRGAAEKLARYARYYTITPELQNYLLTALENGNDADSHFAAVLLESIPQLPDQAVQAIVRVMPQERMRMVRGSLLRALVQASKVQAQAALIDALRHARNDAEREALVDILAEDAAEMHPMLAPLLGEASLPDLQIAAIEVLMQDKAYRAKAVSAADALMPALLQNLRMQDTSAQFLVETRHRAMERIVRLAPASEQAQRAALDMLGSSDPYLVRLALWVAVDYATNRERDKMAPYLPQQYGPQSSPTPTALATQVMYNLDFRLSSRFERWTRCSDWNAMGKLNNSMTACKFQ